MRLPVARRGGRARPRTAPMEMEKSETLLRIFEALVEDGGPPGGRGAASPRAARGPATPLFSPEVWPARSDEKDDFKGPPKTLEHPTLGQPVQYFNPEVLHRSLDPGNAASPAHPLAQDREVEVDLVIEGGGMKGYYVAGVTAVLNKHRNVKVRRVAGASAGSLAAVTVVCNIDPSVWAVTYEELSHGRDERKESLLETYRRIFERVLPANAYKLCSGRLYISTTIVTSRGLEHMQVSEFADNDDLFNAMCASCFIPYFTLKSGTMKFCGHYVLDGGFTVNLPLFTDSVRPQIAVKLSEVVYAWTPMSWLVPPLDIEDTCIEALALRGGYDMKRFMRGEKVPSIVWYDAYKPGTSYISKYGTTLLGLWLARKAYRLVSPSVAPFSRRTKRRLYLLGLGAGVVPYVAWYGWYGSKVVGTQRQEQQGSKYTKEPNRFQLVARKLDRGRDEEELAGHWAFPSGGEPNVDTHPLPHSGSIQSGLTHF